MQKIPPSPLAHTYAKNRGSGNRVSDFCVSGGPPVLVCTISNPKNYLNFESLILTEITPHDL